MTRKASTITLETPRDSLCLFNNDVRSSFTMGQHTISLPKLHSDRSSERLKIISGLRRRGIGEHISLPQLIVCGDQSVGKSSVLEGITGFPFPRQDGLCTRFATEIILEDGPEPTNVLISIIPHSSQSQERKDEMLAFARSMTTLSDLPQVINEAGALMGLKGFAENHDGPAFGKDVLRIRISGPTGLHLSVVDLPGIIQVPSEDQQLEDVEAVHELVDSYMANPRSIILAVVQAGNDIANQPVIRKSKKFDKLGQRTIGIITKPDLINRGTEARIALLSRNEDTTKLELGFFLLKNPSPEEMAEDLDQARREALELKFFTSPPWSAQSLLQDRVGIARLRVYLQGLLDQHIDAAMPKVRNELRELQQKTREQLDRLGGERNTPTDIRIYLSRLAMSLSSLCAAALQGAYAQDRFFDRAKKDVVANRLRALIHSQNMEFATTMLSSGAKYKVKSAASSDAESDPEDHITGDGQAAVSEKRMNKWIQKVPHPVAPWDSLLLTCGRSTTRPGARSSRETTTPSSSPNCSTNNPSDGTSSRSGTSTRRAAAWRPSCSTPWRTSQTKRTHARASKAS